MREAVSAALPADIYIGAAAVADYTPRAFSPNKIKKTGAGDTLAVVLVRTPDILAEVAAQTQALKLVVGFAAETNNVAEYARKKLEAKRLDMIVANRVGIADGGFESDRNAMTAYWKEGDSLPTLKYEDASPWFELPPGERGYGGGKIIPAEIPADKIKTKEQAEEAIK